MYTHSFTILHIHTHACTVKWVKQNVGKHQMNGIHNSHLTAHNISERVYTGPWLPSPYNSQSDKPFYVCVNLMACNTWRRSSGCLQLREKDVIMQLIWSGKCVLHCVIYLNSIWIKHYVCHCLMSVKKYFYHYSNSGFRHFG